MSGAPRVATYVRVSTGQQVEKWGLSTQRTAVAAHAARMGWTVVEAFEDPGISGETLDARPGMLALLEGVRARRFDYVLAVEWERFSRSDHARDWAAIFAACEDGGARLATPGQVLDPTSPEDSFLGGLFGLLAARERRKIAERTRRGRRARAAEGKWAVGVAPYGYRVGADGRLEIDEERAQVVRWAFAELLAGRSLNAIARDLNLRGLTPPGRLRGPNSGGKVWRPVAIRRMLENPTYTGAVVYGSRSHSRGDQPIRVDDAHPAIVPPHEFARLGAVYRARHAAGSGYPRSHWDSGFLLTGLLRCATCGVGMKGKSTTPRRKSSTKRQRQYVCRSTAYTGNRDHPQVNAYAAEEYVLSELVSVLASPDVLAEVRRQRVEMTLRGATAEARRRDELRAAIEASEATVRTTYADRVAGILTPAQFVDFNGVELERQRVAREELRAIEDRLLALGAHADVEQLVCRLTDVARLLEVATSAEKKLLLAETIAAVHATRVAGVSRWTRYSFRIEWRLPALAQAAAPPAIAPRAHVKGA